MFEDWIMSLCSTVRSNAKRAIKLTCFDKAEASLAKAGEAVGLAPDVSLKLARATVTGSGELAYQSPESAEQLRINVTSPGGTTAAGLAVLMPELTDLVTRTVAAATKRGQELGK